MKTLIAGMLALIVTSTAPGVIHAQSPGEGGATPPPTEAQDSVQLVFEREVFTYPAFQRRNPFAPLTGDESGPRFEQLRLMAVLLSSAPGQSIALLATGTGEGVRTYRVRAGDVVGNMRVLRIDPRQITLEVDEFGIRETRVLEQRRPGTGGAGSPENQDIDEAGGTAPPDTTGAAGVDPDSTGSDGATGVDPDSTGTLDMNGTGGLA